MQDLLMILETILKSETIWQYTSSVENLVRCVNLGWNLLILILFGWKLSKCDPFYQVSNNPHEEVYILIANTGQ